MVWSSDLLLEQCMDLTDERWEASQVLISGPPHQVDGRSRP